MIKKAAAQLHNADDIMIITHLRPDGDTLGSAFALYNALKCIGKNVCVCCDTQITPKYRLITDGESDLKPKFNPKYIVSVDIADIKLFGGTLIEYGDKVDLVIDHHPTNSGFGKLNYIEPSSSSTGELVFKLINEMGIVINKKIADCIYIALSTDTGCFRYSNTTADTFKTAAKLYEIGADIAELNRRFFEIRTRSQIELERQALRHLNYYRGGKVAIIVVSLEMIEKTFACEDDVDGLSAFPRRIEGVEVGLTLREISNGEFKVSARSNGFIDVSQICVKYGGGGHKRAAGCIIKGDIYEIEKNLVTDIESAFEGVNA